jgi:hypothetical protein
MVPVVPVSGGKSIYRVGFIKYSFLQTLELVEPLEVRIYEVKPYL